MGGVAGAQEAQRTDGVQIVSVTDRALLAFPCGHGPHRSQECIGSARWLGTTVRDALRRKGPVDSRKSSFFSSLFDVRAQCLVPNAQQQDNIAVPRGDGVSDDILHKRTAGCIDPDHGFSPVQNPALGLPVDLRCPGDARLHAGGDSPRQDNKVAFVHSRQACSWRTPPVMRTT